MIWLAAVLPLLVLGLVAFNVLTWPRAQRPASGARVSVLIPARNEAEQIEAAVRAAFASASTFEVIVYEDCSTDDTAKILDRLATQFERLRIVPGVQLPAGWAGKPHACHRLASQARGDVWLFVDADVRLAGDAPERVTGLMRRYQADVFTGVPAQDTVSFWERAVVPLLHLTYTAWLPLPLIWRSQDPRFLAANGQLLALTPAAYQTSGGFEAVRQELVEDMALTRNAKRRGLRVLFADAQDLARCRMYRSGREVWEGFSKNLYEGLGARWYALFAALALNLLAFVLPYGMLVGSLAKPQWMFPATVGVASNLLLRLLLVIRFKHPASSVFWHPLAVLGLVAIGLNSFVWAKRGKIRWRGRVYADRARRAQGVA